MSFETTFLAKTEALTAKSTPHNCKGKSIHYLREDMLTLGLVMFTAYRWLFYYIFTMTLAKRTHIHGYFYRLQALKSQPDDYGIFFLVYLQVWKQISEQLTVKKINIESLFCRTASKLPETLVGYQKKVSLKRWKIENMILIQLFKPEVAEIARSFASFRVEPELSICVILTKWVVILYSFDTFSGKQFGVDFYSFKYLSIEKK